METVPLSEEDQLKAKIKCLEKDVLDLEERCKEMEDGVILVMTDEFKELLRDHFPEVSAVKKNKFFVDVCHLEDQLEANLTLTNIAISDVRIKMLERDEAQKKCLHTIVGECGGVEFSVICTVVEEQNVDDPSTYITKLDLALDGDKLGPLAFVIPSIEQKKDIQTFFRFIQSFAEESSLRHDTFSDCQTQFNGVVEVALDKTVPYLEIIHNRPRQRWRICWDFKVTSLYKVIPYLYLDMDLTHEDNPHTETVTQTFTELFEISLKECGIAAAINTVVQLVIS